jgi:integrase
MLRAKRLDDAGVAGLKIKPKRYAVPDPELRGHYVRVMPTGAKSFWVVARDPKGKQIWKRIGGPPMPIADAREKAMRVIRAVRSTTIAETVDNASFAGVAAQWFERHVVKNGLISEKDIRSQLRNHILPAFVGMDFVDVRRKHVAAMLDHVEDAAGARTADYCLSVLNSICSWYAKRDEDYSSPIMRGMGRQEKRPRSRILTEAEIRMLWAAEGTFGNFTKLCLLTAQRFGKIASLQWSEIEDGVWYIPGRAREKGTGEALRLPKLALDVLADQQRLTGGDPFVFAPKGSIKNRLNDQKRDFNNRSPFVTDWTIHDLRRTARSLMAAAGVTTLHAELIMGHKQKGVVGTYDRHEYLDEKGDALDRLARKLADIVTPPPDNVTRLRKAG